MFLDNIGLNKLKPISIKCLATWMFCFLAVGIVVGNIVGVQHAVPILIPLLILFLLIVLLFCFSFLKGAACCAPTVNFGFDVSVLIFFFLLGMLLITPYVEKKQLYNYPKHKESSVFAKVSDGISTAFHNDFSKSTAGFLDSIILGRRGINRDLRKIFRDAGTAHVIVISGMHVGIIAVVLLLILNFLRVPFSVRYILVCVFVIFYALLCFNKPPVMRAAIMFSLFCVFRLLQRPFLNFHTLSLAGIISLIYDPSVLFGASFQLSFTAVLFIMIGFKYFYPKPKKSLIMHVLNSAVFMSLYACVGLLPIISYYFGKIFLFSWVSGTAVVPLLTFIVYGVFVYGLFRSISVLNELCANALNFLIEVFVGLNAYFSAWPIMSIDYRFSLIQIFLYYFIFILILVWRTRFVLNKDKLIYNDNYR